MDTYDPIKTYMQDGNVRYILWLNWTAFIFASEWRRILELILKKMLLKLWMRKKFSLNNETNNVLK